MDYDYPLPMRPLLLPPASAVHYTIMKASFVFLAIPLIFGCATAEAGQVFHGVVVREDGTPVMGAPVVLYENLARKWTWFPKNDREIARAVTNKKGEFGITTSDATPARKLMLVAKSEWNKVKVSPGNALIVSRDGLLLKVSKNRSNIITVPLDYVPKKQP